MQTMQIKVLTERDDGPKQRPTRNLTVREHAGAPLSGYEVRGIVREVLAEQRKLHAPKPVRLVEGWTETTVKETYDRHWLEDV